MKKIITLLLLLNIKLAHSAEFIEYGQSIRSLGMGGAYLAVVNDADALFYNPAALNSIGGIDLSIFKINAGLNGQQIYEDLKDKEFNDITDYSELYGQDIWLGLGGKAAVAVPHFGVGVYDSGFISSRLNNPAFPSLDMTYINDYGIIVGTSFTIDDKSSYGINFKRITRSGGVANIGLDVISSEDQDLLGSFTQLGSGYGIDFGYLYNTKNSMNASFAIVWKDVGSTAFIAEQGKEAPPRQKDDLGIGMSFGFDTLLVGMTGAIDIKHLMDYSEPITKKIHMGLELDLPFVDIRGGFYQGYSTMGLGLDLFIFEFEVAQYSVEKGAYAGQTPDGRIQASLSCELSLDADFSFISMDNNTKRKLKRRR